MGDATLFIERARGGSRGAFDRIFELLYPELRQIAHRRLSRGARDRLIYSATVMRSIIVDEARLREPTASAATRSTSC